MTGQRRAGDSRSPRHWRHEPMNDLYWRRRRAGRTGEDWKSKCRTDALPFPRSVMTADGNTAWIDAYWRIGCLTISRWAAGSMGHVGLTHDTRSRTHGARWAFFFFFYKIRIYTRSLHGIAGYAGAYPAYPVAPPPAQTKERLCYLYCHTSWDWSCFTHILILLSYE
jgi:hypothetical protein